MSMVSSLLCVAAWVACVAETGASPTTVNGARGHSVSLHTGIPAGPDVADVTWRLLSTSKKIVTYSNKSIDYYGSEEYKQRINFHPGNFSLEIHDLQREDTGDYELTVTASSGAQTRRKMRLQVFDPVSGTVINVQHTTKTCNITLTCSANFGSSISFRWWRRGEVVGSGNQYLLQQHGEKKEFNEVLYKCEAWNPISNETAEVWLGDTCEKNKSDEIPILEGAVGHVALLSPDILKAADVTEVVWRILSRPTKIAECVNGKFTSFGTEKYKQRIGGLHDCSLKIHDVRQEDTNVYEVIVTSSSETRTKMKMLLKVSDWAGTVKGAPGQTVFLPAGITPWQDVSQVVWRSNENRIAENASGSISYFGPEVYKRRITLCPGNFSLEIRDLQREDAGEYEVEISVGSGAESKARVRLEVDESGDRSSHTVWIITGIVIFVILLCCGIGYKKRHDLRLCWNKHMGKKSGTSDEPAVTQSLNSRPDGEQSSLPLTPSGQCVFDTGERCPPTAQTESI